VALETVPDTVSTVSTVSTVDPVSTVSDTVSKCDMRHRSSRRHEDIFLQPMLGALKRARFGILSMAITYMFSVLVGMTMAINGNRYAVAYRDRIVRNATTSDRAMRAMFSGQMLRAAILDFGGNLFLGAVPTTVAGLGIIPPYPMAGYRGWVGGIVSIDGDHRSRLNNAKERGYYLGVLILQLIPFSLTGGAGVYLGLAWYGKWRESGFVRRWSLPLPRSALVDALWIYALAVPLFLIASLFEFLAR